VLYGTAGFVFIHGLVKHIPNPSQAYRVNANINLTPALSKGEGVATLMSINVFSKHFHLNFGRDTRYWLPSPLERGWG